MWVLLFLFKRYHLGLSVLFLSAFSLLFLLLVLSLSALPLSPFPSLSVPDNNS
jgi:hypothetical protein